MVRCSEGHFYDPAKHTSCPWCAKPLDLGGSAGDPAAGKTKPLKPAAEDSPGMTAPLPTPTAPMQAAPVQAAGPTPGATRRLVDSTLGMDPVVGWLVCLDGPDRGRDFRIKSEKNFVGRAPTMHISISGDETISREKHATVTYDPKKRSFWLLPGEATGLVYLNGDAVYTPAQLKERDIIELGKTKLTFVAFVNDSFYWQE